MKILSTYQIKEADAYTIAHEPISSINLMERAAQRCTDWIMQRFDTNYTFVVFAGMGNNGGDGMAIARLLAEKGYQVEVFVALTSKIFSSDCKTNLERLISQKKVVVKNIVVVEDCPVLSAEIVVDALFGSGLSRPLEGLAAQIVQHINQSVCTTIAIDIPSGLFGEYNDALYQNYRSPDGGYNNVIRAHYTLTFQFPKLAFMLAQNHWHVGKFEVLDIGLHPAFLDNAISPYRFVTLPLIKLLIKKRPKFSHKGTYGHSLIIAGSKGKIGAAVLALRGCLRSGIGLLTAYIPECGYHIVQTSVPEAMTDVDICETHISTIIPTTKYNSIAIGPGLGTHSDTAVFLYQLLQQQTKPMVIDADALNILANNPTWIANIPENSILTPHPKEFDRLVGESETDYQRLMKACDFATKRRVVVVLKGTHTAIACPNGECFFNSTGNPGMATGGSGDVLTGIITALLAQGYSPEKAAVIGVYAHGLAGDIAAQHIGQEALIASDLTDYLGKAFLHIQNNS